ncbi:MAG: DUF5320 domain-containing protein [bacterium]|nr:DUF5320 domain-containing protein [bacterium]
MPGFDRTGPEGRGPMTGGGRGLCRVPLRNLANRLGRPRRRLTLLGRLGLGLRWRRGGARRGSW